jgi:uncharacterized HhH-GPD family protein
MGGLDRMIENGKNGASLTGKPEADAFLRTSPDGLMYGALFDQQMRAELAFLGGHKLHERLGHLDAARIAAMDAAEFETLFRKPPGIHRFGGMMAERTQKLAAYMGENHAGSIASLWTDSPEDSILSKRFEKLPGYGPAKASVLLEALDLFGHRKRTHPPES